MPLPQDATSIDSVMADVGARTLELLLRAGVLSDDELTGPSRLPGWTRGHVLAHLADNARAFAAVARRAAEAPADAMDAGAMYASQEARDRSIEEGAGRSRARHLADLVGSAHAFAAAWRRLPEDRLGATVSGTSGWTRPVRDVPWMRWRELALHRVDLGWPAGFAPADPLVARLVDEAADAWAGRTDAPGCVIRDLDRARSWQVGAGGTRVEGPTGDLALWLTGRSDGSALTSSGPLPVLPPWL